MRSAADTGRSAQRRHGHAGSNVAPTVEIGLQSTVACQIRLQGSCASSGEFPACISLISRRAIRVEPRLAAVAPLEEGSA